ncbi:hypothetical protein K501DRAFT_324044 [Backusella circina FSU 941]|nr:hypothetical protein K501DRAFT_324044 [Backusella circina FSU 941]
MYSYNANSLDMSTASFVLSQSGLTQSASSNNQTDLESSLHSTASSSSSMPPIPSPSLTEPPAPLETPLPPIAVGPSNPPSTFALLAGHVKFFAQSSLRFIFKDNNLPLLINLIYHLMAARNLLTQPWRTVVRYLSIPPASPSSSAQVQQQVHRTTAIATDTFRAIGAMHLSLAALSALALKERRQASERSALLVLTLNAVGQAYAHLTGYWEKTGSQYTLKAIQEIGASDAVVLLVCSIALSKTIRRTGRFI